MIHSDIEWITWIFNHMWEIITGEALFIVLIIMDNSYVSRKEMKFKEENKRRARAGIQPLCKS